MIEPSSTSLFSGSQKPIIPAFTRHRGMERSGINLTDMTNAKDIELANIFYSSTQVIGMSHNIIGSIVF